MRHAANRFFGAEASEKTVPREASHRAPGESKPRQYDLALLDVFAPERGFQAFQVEAARPLGQHVHRAEMGDVQNLAPVNSWRAAM
jgi:hypothetical protein